MRLDEFQIQRKSNDASFPPVLDDEGGGGGPRNGKFWMRGSKLITISGDDDYAQSVYVDPQAFGMTMDQVLAILDERDPHTARVLRDDRPRDDYWRRHPASHGGGRFQAETILFERGWSVVESHLPSQITLWCHADKLLQCAKDMANKFGVLEAEVIRVSTLDPKAKDRNPTSVQGFDFHREDYGYGGHFAALLKWAQSDERPKPIHWLYYSPRDDISQGIEAEHGSVNHGNAYYRDRYFIRYEPSVMGMRPRDRSKMVRFSLDSTRNLTDLKYTYDEMKMSPVIYQGEPFTIPPEAIQAWNGRQWVPMRASVMEKAPPGKKAKRFIKKAKADFKDRYGKAWKQVLYATAWKMFGESYDRHNVDLWRRWWANFRTGGLIAVPNGVQHDEYLFDNLDDFLSDYAIEEAMDGATDPWEAVDPLLLTTYAAGWQAVLYDATQKVLCLRSGTTATPAMMAKVATKLAAEIEIVEVALDAENGDGTSKSYRMRDDELERFLSRGMLPAKSFTTESFTAALHPDVARIDQEWPRVGELCSGLRVTNRIPNMGSIGASLDDWIELPGVREVPIPYEDGEVDPPLRGYHAELRDQIAENGWIDPLIVVVDRYGPGGELRDYILEGSHRIDALRALRKASFPALVVFDNGDGEFDADEPQTLTESLSALVRFTPNLLRKVRKFADFIASDIAEDNVPEDDVALTQKLQSLLARIEHSAGHGDKLIVERAELRPLDHVEGFSSTGAHWTWEDGNARVCHHDNAYDEHGRDNVVEITIVAEVAIRDVDWAYTFATNLIHPGEAEITVRNNAKVLVSSIWHEHKEHLVNQRATVYGSYDSH